MKDLTPYVNKAKAKFLDALYMQNYMEKAFAKALEAYLTEVKEFADVVIKDETEYHQFLQDVSDCMHKYITSTADKYYN